MDLKQEIERRRTFAIISPPDAGKTTLTEKLLLYGGAIQLAGSVKGKATARHAVSDWMELEKQRGISITSSVMQFEYEGYCINILDTPGHQDFSEDTYRTLMAADSAVMVIDAAKGIEPQTRKLFKICAMRHIPIFTFINKLDREARDPFELMEQLENEFGIGTYPVNWPIGCGHDFKGVFDRDRREILAFQEFHRGQNKIRPIECELTDVDRLDELIGPRQREKLTEDIELLDGAGYAFDLDEVRAGRLSPVFFGSALTNFGVEPFLENFLHMTMPPLPRTTADGVVDPMQPAFSAFVFKIQANMNKAHRDRIAFMRICSGKFERDHEYLHVQGGKTLKLAQPQQLMAQERAIINEAYAGDIIGVFDPGIFSIGDTICDPKVRVRFEGIPTFAPEHFFHLAGGHHETQAVCQGCHPDRAGGRHPDLPRAEQRHGGGHRRCGRRAAVRGAGVSPQERVQHRHPPPRPVVFLYPLDHERGHRPHGAQPRLGYEVGAGLPRPQPAHFQQ